MSTEIETARAALERAQNAVAEKVPFYARGQVLYSTQLLVGAVLDVARLEAREAAIQLLREIKGDPNAD